jgi:hypothetical protein
MIELQFMCLFSIREWSQTIVKFNVTVSFDKLSGCYMAEWDVLLWTLKAFSILTSFFLFYIVLYVPVMNIS